MHTNPFLICKASAGAGKTYRLVIEYLKICFDGPIDERSNNLHSRMKSILAITFTNKATNEMKSRIMEELDYLSNPLLINDKKSMASTLIKELNETDFYRNAPLDEKRLQEMAYKLRAIILHHYSDFSVCTIDSFMHRIVRTFAHDLDIPLNFELLTESDTLIENAVDQMMQHVGTPEYEDLTHILQTFAETNMSDEKSFNIERQVKELAAELFKDDASQHLYQLKDLKFDQYRTLYSELKKANEEYLKKLKSQGNKALEIFHNHGIGIDNCYYKAKGFYGHFTKMTKGEATEINSYTQKSILDDGKMSSGNDEQIERTLTALRPKLRSILEEVDRDRIAYNTRNAVMQKLFSVALLNLLNNEVQHFADNNEVLHISEFNKMIYATISGEPAPFIFERLGSRYQHFLIDEFQDTSTMQWHNLIPLVSNGLSEGKKSLVVGDGKQAIYRFRGGEVMQFVNLPKVDGALPDHQQPLLNHTTLNLQDNYRTFKSIVNFNNRFFKWIAQNPLSHNEMISKIYLGNNANEEEAELWQHPTKGEHGLVSAIRIENMNEARDEEILKIVNELHQNHGYNYHDIMVLTRTNKELVGIGNHLSQIGKIPITSAESFNLRESHAVMLVVAALRYVIDPHNRTAMAEIIERLQCLNLISPQCEYLFLDPNIENDFPKVLRQLNPALDFKPAYLSALGLYDCCEEVIRMLQIGQFDTTYLAAFLNKVASFSTRYHQGIHEFINWLDDNKQLSATGPEEIDAVKLLTIHKAKGLEAPVVICPLSKSSNKAPRMWVDIPDNSLGTNIPLSTTYVELSKSTPTAFEDIRLKEKMHREVDDINTLYVALTRPREQLYILYTPQAKISSKKEEFSVSFPKLIDEFIVSQKPDMGDPDCIKQPPTNKKEKKTVDRLTQVSFNDWTTKVRIASPSEKNINRRREEKIQFGNLLHDLMAQIHHAADVDQALVSLFKEQEVDSETITTLTKLSHNIVAHPYCKDFFNTGNIIKNECRLLYHGQERRPDRIVITPLEIWVIDYKTGLYNYNEDKIYQNQITEYCHILNQMGYPNVHGCLLYLLPNIERHNIL